MIGKGSGEIGATQMQMRTAIVLGVVWLVCSTTANAQARSRADVQLGIASLDAEPGFLMGASIWVGRGAGVAVAGILAPGFSFQEWRANRAYSSVAYGDYQGFQVRYRHRGRVRGLEIDVGVGLIYVSGQRLTSRTVEDGVLALARERSGWGESLAVDLLVGWRPEGTGVGVKAGVGSAGGTDGANGLVAKFMAVVPVGSL